MQVLETLADGCGVEPISVFYRELRAQRLGIAYRLVAAEGDGAEAVALALFDGKGDVDALALARAGR